jgi:hypothetical protein
MIIRKTPSELMLAIAVGLIFAALFLYLTVPVTDPDFWWHLASGKWILDHGALMSGDPFTIDSPFKREAADRYFVLKQYWLAQIIFYVTYVAAGLKGIILQTAAVFTLMFFVMYRLTRKTGIHQAVALILLYLAVMVIVSEFGYIGARPQMWSSLFSVMVIWILEELKDNRKWSYFGLPLLMVLWANMHGGFILGDIIIACYLVGGLVSRSSTRTFQIVTVTALLASGLNPNGFSVLSSAPLLGSILTAIHLPGFEHQREAAESISEAKSIFQHTSLAGIIKGLPFFTAIFLLSLTSFIGCYARTRTIRTEYLLLFVLVLLMAFRSIRFIIFFTTIATYITAMNLNGIFDSFPRVKTSRHAAVAVTLIIALLMSARLGMAGIRSSDLFSDTAFEGDYKQAADFVANSRIQGNIFNDYNAGGYLLWRLARTNRIFVDGRVLYGELFDIFRSTVDDPFAPVPNYILNYKRTLEFFNIDIVMIPGCDAVSGTLIRLVPALLDDPAWALVYVDQHALVFVRDSAKNDEIIRKFRRPGIEACSNIYTMALRASKTGHAARMANWKLSLAYALARGNEPDMALRWINEYLAQKPDDSFARSLKEKILVAQGRPAK